jgi:hypothetical protein
MKRLLLIVLAVGLLVLLAAGVFLATFDADRYRPQLVHALEDASGLGVRLGHLSLGWHGGLALELQDLTVHESAAAAGEPLLELDSASALVRFAPLLRRRVDVASVVLRRPRARLRRDPQGRLVLPLPAAAPPSAGSAAGVTDAMSIGRQPAAEGAVVSFNVASLRVEDGTLHWTDASAAPPVELWVQWIDATVTDIVPGRPMDVRVQAAVGGDAPNVRFSGRLTLPEGSQPGSLRQFALHVDRLTLELVLPRAAAGEPHLTGRLSTSLDGDAASLEPAALALAASARGTVRLEEPIVENLNVLREVFQQLSMLPGLLERLNTRLPQTYRAKLDARDTVLQPFELPLELSGGALRFSGLSLQSDTFGLTGQGSVGLDGSLGVQAVLRVDPQFSEALIRSVEELRALTNANGELELPLTIQGRAPRLAVLPDLQYIASRVLTVKAVDALGRLLQRGEPEGGSSDTVPPPAGADGLLGAFLQKALERHAPAHTSSQSGQ